MTRAEQKKHAALQRSDTQRILQDIEDRVRPTICPTFSSSGGDEGRQGRISAEDFEALAMLAGAALFVRD